MYYVVQLISYILSGRQVLLVSQLIIGVGMRGICFKKLHLCRSPVLMVQSRSAFKFTNYSFKRFNIERSIECLRVKRTQWTTGTQHGYHNTLHRSVHSRLQAHNMATTIRCTDQYTVDYRHTTWLPQYAAQISVQFLN